MQVQGRGAWEAPRDVLKGEGERRPGNRPLHSRWGRVGHVTGPAPRETFSNWERIMGSRSREERRQAAAGTPWWRVRSRWALVAVALLVAIGVLAVPAMTGARRPDLEAAEIVVYKSPTCGCCGKWIEHMIAEGFTVRVENVPDVAPIKRRHAIPEKLWSCHTSTINGYAIEGHVPADVIATLLRERKAVAGIAVPGMPQGAPGMEQGSLQKDRYEVLAFTADGRIETYAVR